MAIKIIAEAGVNHNGSLELARQMVAAAAEAGADYIKFQTFIPEKLVSASAQKADYQKQNTGEQESQLDMLRRLALPQEDFWELKECCRQQGIGFLSTPFDLDSIAFLETLGMDFWKLPSGEITNLPYLVKIAGTGRPIVMSTGMCELEEVRQKGYALDAREMEDHMECVGAPVFGSDNSVVGAISVSSLYKPGEDYDALGRMVCQKAEEVSRLLGFLGKKS